MRVLVVLCFVAAALAVSRFTVANEDPAFPETEACCKPLEVPGHKCGVNCYARVGQRCWTGTTSKTNEDVNDGVAVCPEGQEPCGSNLCLKSAQNDTRASCHATGGTCYPANSATGVKGGNTNGQLHCLASAPKRCGNQCFADSQDCLLRDYSAKAPDTGIASAATPCTKDFQLCGGSCFDPRTSGAKEKCYEGTTEKTVPSGKVGVAGDVVCADGFVPCAPTNFDVPCAVLALWFPGITDTSPAALRAGLVPCYKSPDSKCYSDEKGATEVTGAQRTASAFHCPAAQKRCGYTCYLESSGAKCVEYQGHSVLLQTGQQICNGKLMSGTYTCFNNGQPVAKAQNVVAATHACNKDNVPAGEFSECFCPAVAPAECPKPVQHTCPCAVKSLLDRIKDGLTSVFNSIRN